MKRMIAPVVRKVNLHQMGTDFSYWQSESFESRIPALEEIRREYRAREESHRKDAAAKTRRQAFDIIRQ